MNKKKVAFICVHNSCRSQIAEALGKHLASDKLRKFYHILVAQMELIINTVFVFQSFFC